MQLNSTETQRLIDRCLEGQEQEFGRLIDRHRPFLRLVVSLRIPDKLRSRIDPSDVVQEAQIEAVRRKQEYFQQQAMPFRLWLRRITYERLLTAWRKHGKAEKRSVEREVSLTEESSLALANGLLSQGPSPLTQFAQEEIAERVRQAIARLSDPDREIVLLHNFEGLTSKEAALVLGIEPAAARKRYGRALLRLRQLLIDEGFSESAHD